jgi:Zn-dependent protease with chaperone function
MNLVVRTNLILGFALLVGLLFLSQMAFFVAHQLWGTHLLIDIFQYCISAVKEGTELRIAIYLIINVIILYTVSRMLNRIIKQMVSTHRLITAFQEKKHRKLTKKMNFRYRQWKTEIIVVQDDHFVALTLGLYRPRIIISTGLIHMFSEQEVQAILLHELYHCKNRDPLRMFLLTLIQDSMGYIPMMKSMVQEFRTWKELLADRFAIKQMGTEYYLGNVLLKLSHTGQTKHTSAVVYFADNAINYRIMQVLEPDRSVRFPISRFNPILLNLSIFLILGSLIQGGCS